MPTFFINQMPQLLQDSDHTRILSIINFSTDSEPSEISDLLARKARICIKDEPDYSDTRPNEIVRKIGLRRDCSSMLYYEKNSQETGQKTAYLLNLIHLTSQDFLYSQLNDTLRIIDGILVIINCQEHLSMQTEVSLRRVLREKIKPVIAIDIDTNFLDLQQDAETIYQKAFQVIHNINLIISSYQQSDIGDLRVSPEEGNIAFVSEKHGWGFTLETFAKMYTKKFGTDTELMAKLWGDNYYDPENKKWCTQNKTEDGKTLKRGFVQFIMDPIMRLTRCIMEGDEQQLEKILEKLDIKRTEEDKKLKSDRFAKAIFSRWINVADCLLEMATIHLPSPKCAQKYRTSYLYEGPQDDICSQAMRECNPKGPLMIYISQMIPTPEKGRFYALGRVFSGTVIPGQKVRIMGPNYKQGKKEDLFSKCIQRTLITSSQYPESVEAVPAGNIVYLVGIDQYLLKNGTISDCEEAHTFGVTTYSTSPVVRVAVQPKNSADLARLVDGLRLLSKSTPFAQVEAAETGEHLISGSHDLHLEMSLKSLKEDYARCEIIPSEFFVSYKESISQASILCMANSPNKHNRLYCTAQPLSEGLCQAIEKNDVGPRDDRIIRTKRLTEEFEWDTEDANQIWAFGPDNMGPNIFVNMTTGVEFIKEIKDSCDSAFQWFTKEGVLCEETLRQVRVNIVDASLHTDAIHRGGGQIIPTARRVFYACQLTAQPRLQEPIYLVEIIFTNDALKLVYESLNQRRGTVLEEKPIEIALSIQSIKCHLPAADSFGFMSDLVSLTNGGAYANIIATHWLEIEEDPLNISSNAFKVMNKIRQRKGLREGPPDLANYIDNL